MLHTYARTCVVGLAIVVVVVVVVDVTTLVALAHETDIRACKRSSDENVENKKPLRDGRDKTRALAKDSTQCT